MVINDSPQYENTLLELHYLPSLEYFIVLLNTHKVFIESQENFVKQSYRNRCYVKGANKTEMLSIPIKKGKKHYKDIKIDYHQGWLNDHWRTITTAYGKSPFFEYYRDGFESILFKKENFLFDLNWQLLTKCLEYLGIDIALQQTDKYVKSVENTVLDLRGVILPNRPAEERKIYKPHPYQQVFGKGFVNNLSIVDLLCCEGPGAKSILLQSKGAGYKQ